MTTRLSISERHSKAALLASTTAVLILAGVLFAAELDAQGNIAPLAAGRDLCSGVSLAPGQSCPIGVKITPTSSEARTATLSIPSNGSDEYVISKSAPLTALWHELFAN